MNDKKLNFDVVYLWYNHLNPHLKIKEIEEALNNHNWKVFKKWLKWQEKQPLMYFPSHADVYVGNEYIGQILINKDTFHLITSNDHECG